MTKVIILVLAIVLGVAAVIEGQLDDSPGLGGIGLILIALSVWMLVRARRRRSV